MGKRGVLGPILQTPPLALRSSRTALLQTAVCQWASLLGALASTLKGVSTPTVCLLPPWSWASGTSRFQGFLWTPLGLAKKLQSPFPSGCWGAADGCRGQRCDLHVVTPLSYAPLPRVPEKESPPSTPMCQITRILRKNNMRHSTRHWEKSPQMELA